MRDLKAVTPVWVAMTLLALAAWAPVSEAAGPILKQRGESEIEIDLGMILDDFLPSLIELAAVEDPTAPEKIRMLVDALGCKALDRLHVHSSIDEERAESSLTVTLDPAVDAGLLGRMVAIPPGQFHFGRYLGDEEVVAVVFAAGMQERILALNDFFASPAVRELDPEIPSDPLSFTAMWKVNAREDILPFLSGELDLVLFNCTEGRDCSIPSVALVLGLTDGAAFREKLLDLLANVLGPEGAAELRDAPAEQAGEFTFYTLWPGLAYALSPEFGILTTDPDRLKTVVTRRGKGLPAVKATSYMRINGGLALGMLGAALETAGDGSRRYEATAELLRQVGEGPVGTIEFMTRTEPGRVDVELEFPTSLYEAEYTLLKDFLAIVPTFQAEDERQIELRGIVGQLDEALTRWGEEHDGTFPENLEVLVEAGYLDGMPALTPSPLGRYVDGGYTYLPLRDDDGRVVGHYFFVYGVNENEGHDVFTSENVLDPASFAAAKDGKKDGVVGFSYDGIALEHMRAWSED